MFTTSIFAFSQNYVTSQVTSTCLSDDVTFNLIDERHVPHVQELT